MATVTDDITYYILPSKYVVNIFEKLYIVSGIRKGLICFLFAHYFRKRSLNIQIGVYNLFMYIKDTSFRVCIIVSNSPNPCRVYITLCKHRKKRFLLLFYKISSSKNYDSGKGKKNHLADQNV